MVQGALAMYDKASSVTPVPPGRHTAHTHSHAMQAFRIDGVRGAARVRDDRDAPSPALYAAFFTWMDTHGLSPDMTSGP